MVNIDTKEAYISKFKDRLYALLCEREEGGEWQGFLTTLIVELEGFPDDMKTINYVSLKNKMYSLSILRFDLFRKTIFECMNLLSK